MEAISVSLFFFLSLYIFYFSFFLALSAFALIFFPPLPISITDNEYLCVFSWLFCCQTKTLTHKMPLSSIWISLDTTQFGVPVSHFHKPHQDFPPSFSLYLRARLSELVRFPCTTNLLVCVHSSSMSCFNTLLLSFSLPIFYSIGQIYMCLCIGTCKHFPFLPMWSWSSAESFVFLKKLHDLGRDLATFLQPGTSTCHNMLLFLWLFEVLRK